MPTNCDGWDPTPPADGYCEHGVYVGGCGWDLMCQWCEDGISEAERRAWLLERALADGEAFLTGVVRIVADPGIPLGNMTQRLATLDRLILEASSFEHKTRQLVALWDRHGWPDNALIPIDQIPAAS